MSKEKEIVKTSDTPDGMRESGLKAETTSKIEPRDIESEPVALGTAEEETRFMYLGPSIPDSWVTSHQLFIGTREQVLESLAEQLERFPQMKHLLIPTAYLAENLKKIKTQGNILNNYYQEMVSLTNQKEAQ